MIDIKNPQYWDKLWQENLGKHLDSDPVTKWNNKAKVFAQDNDTQHSRQRLDGVLAFLQENKAFWPGMKILDIGCGPGNFSLAFARLGAEVTALDPAPKMLEILREKIGKEKITNIQIVQGLWEELDVEKMGWEKNFDLVFASQSPGLRDLETLLKMNYCSQRYCFASGFDGARKMSLYDAFFREYLGRPYMRNSHDIIYLINLLYSLGHRPTIKFLNLNRQEDYYPNEAEENLLEILTQEELATLKEKIGVFLANLPKEEGKVIQQVRQVVGLVLWQRDKF